MARAQQRLSLFWMVKGGGLKGVREGTGLHGEMDRGVGCQGRILSDLLLDGSLKGMSQFLTQIVPGSHVSVLSERGFESLFVEDVSPVTSSAYGS